MIGENEAFCVKRGLDEYHFSSLVLISPQLRTFSDALLLLHKWHNAGASLVHQRIANKLMVQSLVQFGHV